MSEESLKKSLLLVITLLKCLGMWPTDTVTPALYWIYTSFMLTFFQIPMAVLPIATLFMEEDVGVLRIANCIFLNLQVSIVPFKTVFLLIFHKNLRKAVEILSCDIFNSYTDDHKRIIQEGVKSIRRNFNYVPLCFITVILMSLSSLTSLEEKELFVEMWFPFNPKANLFNYFCVYIFSVAGKHDNIHKWYQNASLSAKGVEFCALTNSAVVVLTCGLLIHATTQINILKHTLKYLVSRGPAQETYERIAKCVEHYAVIVGYVINLVSFLAGTNKCFSFVKLVERSLSLMLSLQFLSCTIVICLSSFLLTVVRKAARTLLLL